MGLAADGEKPQDDPSAEESQQPSEDYKQPQKESANDMKGRVQDAAVGSLGGPSRETAAKHQDMMTNPITLFRSRLMRSSSALSARTTQARMNSRSKMRAAAAKLAKIRSRPVRLPSD